METIGTLLDERLVVLDADVSSAEDCIRLMAGLFEQYGYVQPGYGDAVAAREKEYPTGPERASTWPFPTPTTSW